MKRKLTLWSVLIILSLFFPSGSLLGFDEYFEEPEEEKEEEEEEEFEEEPVDEFREEPVDAFREEPVDEFREEPVDEFREEPVDAFREEPVDEFREEPVDAFREEPVDEFRAAPADPFVKDEFVPPTEDELVLEKREGTQTYKYKEPDLGQILVPTYLYQENTVQAKKVFELYKNDQVVIINEDSDWFKVEFLGREGWVPMQDVRLEKWHSYRVSMELGGGAGSGGGDIKNYTVLGNYFFRINVSILQDIIVGIEGKGISFDADAFYAGGGAVLRYYIHGLRTKRSRSALTVSGGYIGGLEKPGSSYEYQAGETEYKVFSGPYFSAALDYYFRVWEHVALGFGGHFNYIRLNGKTETTDLKKDFVQGGAHISMIFNILR